ncbi:hypothetical protein ACFYNX_27980 [Streptomyces sp. NPDC007872]|uniref:hypothetical protein n=1 Tax=Streptomyces sp. NPDC007872 TaxID=3364782 RepID=UPI00368F33FC
MTRLLRGRAGETDGKAPEPGETAIGAAPAEGGPEPDAQDTPDTPDDGDNESDNDNDSDGDDDSDGDNDNDGDDGGGRFTPRRRTAVLVAAVVALLLGGSGFFYGAHQLRSTPSARNHALTDTAATTRVGGDVGEGLARVFSYAPGQADAAERSAATVLSGRAARQYTDLFAQVRASLVEQRLTLTTQAVRTGVIDLHGNTARLLVFLDQTSRRDTAPATSAAAQLTVTAEFRDDRWLIVDIKAR